MEIKTPRDLAQDRLEEAYQFAKLGERLVDLKKKKAEMWGNIRIKVKSDTQAERIWEATPEGLEEMEIRIKMKCKEHKISAIRTMLEVVSNELKNQY